MKQIAITRSELALVLDLSETTIAKLVNNGVLPKPVKRGQFDVLQCVRAYVRFSRSNARSTLSDERTRWTRARADRAELDLKTRAGQLIEVETVKKVMFERGRAVRDSLTSVADRIAGVVSAESDQTKNHATISREIRQCLEALTA